jgi:hypothetical protein
MQFDGLAMALPLIRSSSCYSKLRASSNEVTGTISTIWNGSIHPGKTSQADEEVNQN